mgnify:FL=1
MVFFTSDSHLGHRVITKYRPQFQNIKEHDEAFLTEMSKLTKRDDLFVLGDFIFDCPDFEYYLKQIAKMPLKVKLVMGNHDSLKMYKQDIAKNIEIQLPLFSYKNMWVSHAPIHPDELRNRYINIHGHLHGSVIKTDDLVNERYFNVNLDNNNFKFVSLETIKERANKFSYLKEEQKVQEDLS